MVSEEATPPPPVYSIYDPGVKNGIANNVEKPPIPEEKFKYPKSVFYIISNEFCERFSYYGMRTILALYLAKLGFSENNSTIIYHVFVMLCYFTPLIGGIIADSYLGKYRTILYVSLLYALGNVVLAVGSINPNLVVISMIGLFLIGTGTGGIKPCVSSFGGDQFVLPQQEKELEKFFSVFYFSINAGSVISCFITPMLRESIGCFGEDVCYPLAFGVPAILMIFSVVIFVVGKPKYKIEPPSKENVAVKVVKCWGHAVSNKMKAKNEEKEHWIDYADDEYKKEFIEETKTVLSLIYLFSPTIVFWALYEQQGSRWTFQANHMDGDLGFYIIQPDQMQTVNAVMCLVFIPIFEYFIYPFLAFVRLVRTPLQKLSWGGMLAAVAFLISGFIQMKIEASNPILPTNNESFLRLYNTLDCPINIVSNSPTDIKDLNLNNFDSGVFTVYNSTFVSLTAQYGGKCSQKGRQEYKIQTQNNMVSILGVLKRISEFGSSIAVQLCIREWSANYRIVEEAVSLGGVVFSHGYQAFCCLVAMTKALISTYMFRTNGENVDLLNVGFFEGSSIEKSENGSVKIRAIYGGEEKLQIKLVNSDGKATDLNFTRFSSDLLEIKSNEDYSVNINGKLSQNKIHLRSGGVYTLLVENANKVTVNLLVITRPNDLNMLWQLPQYFVITFAEIMFSITGIEFAFTQSPKSMKSVISSLWLLTDALGNVIILLIAGIKIFESQASEFFLFAGLMAFVMIIFIGLARNYKYVEKSEETENTEMKTF